MNRILLRLLVLCSLLSCLAACDKKIREVREDSPRNHPALSPALASAR